jgi:hypothetical protein
MDVAHLWPKYPSGCRELLLVSLKGPVVHAPTILYRCNSPDPERRNRCKDKQSEFLEEIGEI